MPVPMFSIRCDVMAHRHHVMTRKTRFGLTYLAAVVTLAFAGTPAAAQTVVTPAQALAQDAAEYARTRGISSDAALNDLSIQEATVGVTDWIAGRYRDRLTGIAIDRDPVFRITVLLRGDDPVADASVRIGAIDVAIQFRTGARASRAELLDVIDRFQAPIRESMSRPPGMGIDPRTGELVILVGLADANRDAPGALRDRLARMTGVPVRIAAIDRPDENLGVEGGGRVIGVNPLDGRRYACTTGFVVTNKDRTGIVTAAHCPDTLHYVDADRREVPLEFVGQWGWGFQDVQVHATTAALRPLFYADTAKSVARPVVTWRNRESTRAGDVVCHRGERTGYSCAAIELVDFAPAGDLCGGACKPTWVTVAGPGCKGGDSGGPVFLGTTAFGILKGGSYRADKSCAFYYYMSVDYLPDGWQLMHQ